jgi:sortase A
MGLMSRRWRVGHWRSIELTAALALCIGMVCFGEATWIRGKAFLAQILIERAWGQARAGALAPKPWPWADTTPIARLELPAHGSGKDIQRLMVLDGVSPRNLAFGPNHDSSSVRPGAQGNSIIEGHRDTHFRALQQVRMGDRVRVQGLDMRWVSFVVVDVRVVDSRRFRIALDADVPRLTLVTCYPFDAIAPGGPLRWVVTADRL